MTEPKTSFLESVNRAGVQAGIEEAKAHQGEIAFQATTAEHGFVKVSAGVRYKMLKAAIFGTWSHDHGAAAGVDGVIKLGKQEQ